MDRRLETNDATTWARSKRAAAREKRALLARLVHEATARADAAAEAERGLPLRIGLADAADREVIYRLRHDVYAEELGQHVPNEQGRLTDALDEHNLYLTAKRGEDIVGFVSITPPGAGRYSIEKYLARDELPFAVDDRLFEIRLLTLVRAERTRETASALIYASYRWVEAHGGTRIVGMGRREVLDLYRRVGMQTTGRVIPSGAVHYELITAKVDDLAERTAHFEALIERYERELHWELDIDLRPGSGACFHGGAFFQAVGERFDRLERREHIVNADVLDAWFPPSPRVGESLREHLDWLLATSPPTGCHGLVETIARVRGLPEDRILVGAGSSSLMYLALPRWLDDTSRVLLLDPTYGEYEHLLDKVIGCQVDRLTLSRSQGYRLDPDELRRRLADGYDLVVLVNPNSPTGSAVGRQALEQAIRAAPPSTRFWVDETYIDYLDPAESLEPFAATDHRTVICKSMSKAYALSGARVAYLVLPPALAESLRPFSPPWAVSLPGQVAAVRALEDPGYYAERYVQTARLREALAADLRDRCGVEVTPGCANFLLCELPSPGPSAADVVSACRAEGLFLRDVSNMGTSLGTRAIRVAVKDDATNRKIVAQLATVLQRLRAADRGERHDDR